MLKSKKNKISTIIFSGLLFFSLLPNEIGHAATKPFDNITTNNVKSSGNIIERNLITKSEKIFPKSKYTENNSRVGESSEAYVPKGSKTKNSEQNVIIGEDSRFQITDTTKFPYSAIGYLKIEFEDGTVGGGTAWMYGNRVAATAGHCIYDKKHGWASGITIVPGLNGDNNMPYGYSFAVNTSVPSEWVSNFDTNNDWGLIQLKDNIGDKTGYFGVFWSPFSIKGSNVDITGYPGDKDFGTLWKMNGNIKAVTSNKVFYDIDTYAGQSGAPVYWNDSSKGYCVAAIHTGGSEEGGWNGATKITKSLYDIMMKFRG